MPGIIGTTKKDFDLFDKMIMRVNHGNKFYIDKYEGDIASVARVHLGIFNPETQPIFNEDKSVCVIMDGEIYDYDDKVEELKKKGHVFKIGNGPEYCMHAFEEHGSSVLSELNGEFVIVILDLANNKLHLINDRYGLRPVYYAIINNELFFASEIKAILENKELEKRLNYDSIADHFSYGYILGNKTFFEGIYVLPHASFFTWNNGDLEKDRYWDYEYKSDNSLTEDMIVKELAIIFKNAVKRRVSPGHKCLISLSGGLDSRMIVAALSEDVDKADVGAFTFGLKNCDEISIAKKVSKKAKIKHTIVEYKPENLISSSNSSVYLTDGQNLLSMGFLVYSYRKLEQDVDIFLQGFANDVMLGGRNLKPEVFNSKNEEDLFAYLHRPLPERLFSRSFAAKLHGKNVESLKLALGSIKADCTANKADCFVLQNKVRRGTSMGSVINRNYAEEAAPTFDNDYIDFILRIPPEYRRNYRIYSKLMKAMSPELCKIKYQYTMLPPSESYEKWLRGLKKLRRKERIRRLVWKYSGGLVYIQNKRSYVNFNDWFRNNKAWISYVKGILFDEITKRRGLYNMEAVERLFLEHERWDRDNSGRIIQLASFEIFMRLMMDDD